MTTYQEAILNARKKFLKLNKEQEKELLRIYKELANQLSEEIATCRTSSQDAYLRKLNEIVEVNINQLNSQLNAIVKANIETSSQIASTVENFYYKAITDNIALSTMFNSMVLNTSRKTVLKLIQGGYYKDGTTLDKRIWNITRKNAKDIDTLIKVNVLRGANARTLAKQVDNYVNPLKRTEAKTIVSGMSSKVSYQAQRLARTSITHSFAETTIENAKSNPFNKGIKWNLSASHSVRMHGKTDECDDYDSKVFKPNNIPLQHPNCMCYFTEENEDIDKAIKKLKAWSEGETNPKLDTWYNNCRVEKSGIKSIKVNNDGTDFKVFIGKLFNKPITEKKILYLKDLPEKDLLDIGNIVNKSPTKLQNIFLKYSDCITFLDINYLKNAKYSPKENGIYINLKYDRKNKHGKGAYTTLFHEIGHLIDKNMGRPSTNMELSESFKNAIINDVNRFITNTKINNNIEDLPNLIDLINRELSDNEKFHSISDIFGAVTQNVIVGRYRHDKVYWERKGALQRETFAHFFEATIRNDKYKLAIIENTMHNAYNIFLDMLMRRE